MPATASAFCGFYVAPGDEKLVNNATRVALMRHGKTTVMSLQPDYEGPAEEFAMVLPVPEVLQKEKVKTLERSLFDTLDQFSSPRMSEYWEQDPCPKPVKRPMQSSRSRSTVPMEDKLLSGELQKNETYVKVKAKFAVGEYDIVILDSNDATALEEWLVERKYNIPDGASPYLAPYIQSGMYFFVAKVNPKRAKFDGNNAILSPLRFHYESSGLRLPIRLGMINAGKAQDIVVFILADQRYKPANYPHAPIPTNIVVKDKTRENFAGFYEGLFARAREKNEDAIITEYVWELATVQQRGGIRNGPKCDPCTSPVQFFTPAWLLSLGLDVFGLGADGTQQPQQPQLEGMQSNFAPPVQAQPPRKIVLTRLHGRFEPTLSNPDIVFMKAPPMVGGMGTPDRDGKLEPTKIHQAGANRFQGRYVILHKWKGKVACKNPQRGLWGAPPNGRRPQAKAAGGPAFGGKTPGAIKPEKLATTRIDWKPPKK